MPYKIIQSGSSGNAVLYHNEVLVDVGVGYKMLAPHIKDIQLILMTHIHSDHFNKTTIKRIAKERPAIRFACGPFLEKELSELGVRNIDVMGIGTLYDYGKYQVSPVWLYHKNNNGTDCPNYGWRIFKDNHKTIHMTDTSTYEGISAKDYDLYAIEANYDEETIDKIIAEQRAEGKYAHGIRSKQTHASYQQALDFYHDNKKDGSELVLLHQSNTYL